MYARLVHPINGHDYVNVYRDKEKAEKDFKELRTAPQELLEGSFIPLGSHHAIVIKAWIIGRRT